MATVPTPTTQVAGLAVPAATINSQGNLATYLAGRTESGGARKALAVLRQTVAQSLTSGTVTPVTFDTEDVDYDGGHSTVTNTSRYVAQTAGYYFVAGTAAFVANATGERVVDIFVNSASLYARVRLNTDSVAASPCSISTSTIVFLNVGDFVELRAFQTSGGALNTDVSAPGAGAQSRMVVQWVSV